MQNVKTLNPAVHLDGDATRGGRQSCDGPLADHDREEGRHGGHGRHSDRRRARTHDRQPDRIIQAGGFISAPTGSAPDADAILVPKEAADTAFDAAACIGCGACVAACPNAAAMLFTSAKITHLNAFPQGQPQRDQRTLSMVVAMANEHFGSCTNHGECEAVCPKEIALEFIGTMNRDLMRAAWRRHREPLLIPGVVQQLFHEDAHEHAEIEVGRS